jgi:hypothetical protein
LSTLQSFLSFRGVATSSNRFISFAAETGEAGFAGEELLHGSLFDVALFGDEPPQPVQQAAPSSLDLGFNYGKFATIKSRVKMIIAISPNHE